MFTFRYDMGSVECTEGTSAYTCMQCFVFTLIPISCEFRGI